MEPGILLKIQIQLEDFKLNVKRRWADPLELVSSEISKELCVVIIQTGCHWLQFQDGYLLHILEFLVEQPAEFVNSIAGSLLRTEFKGSLSTALDFIGMYLLEEGSLTTLQQRDPDTSCSYEELLVRGTRVARFDATPGLEYHEAFLLKRGIDRRIHMAVYLKPPPETYLPIDVVRMALYGNETDPVNYIPYVGAGRCLRDNFGNPHPPGYQDPLVNYIVGYRFPLSSEEESIYDLLLPHFIPPLCEVILDYLCYSPLEKWASELGIIFPPNVTTEAQRFRHYFDEIQDYRRPLLKKVALDLLEREDKNYNSLEAYTITQGLIAYGIHCCETFTEAYQRLLNV